LKSEKISMIMDGTIIARMNMRLSFRRASVVNILISPITIEYIYPNLKIIVKFYSSRSSYHNTDTGLRGKITRGKGRFLVGLIVVIMWLVIFKFSNIPFQEA
ncbi:MAG: hypothetical protein MK007_05240, partial [Flavobacteriales bacterium]|nr:hypothetical protein [Flavobacteriales bacterium]